MKIFVFGQDRLRKEIINIIEATANVYTGPLDKIRSYLDLASETEKLRDQVASLKIEKSQREEEFARKEREIEHKIGLVKLQQETELRHQKETITLEIERKNLENEKGLFKTEMEFRNTRWESEVKYLKDILEKVLKRLPEETIKTTRTAR